MKFSIKDFFSKCNQIRTKQENFIFCAVSSTRRHQANFTQNISFLGSPYQYIFYSLMIRGGGVEVWSTMDPGVILLVFFCGDF